MSDYRLHPSQLDKQKVFTIRTGQTASARHLPLVPRRDTAPQSGVGIIRITMLSSLFGALFWLFMLYTARPELIQSFQAAIHVNDGLATVVQAQTGKVIQFNTGEQMMVSPGDTIISETGSVGIAYATGMSTELAPGTRVMVERLEEGGSAKQVSLLIWAGRTLNKVEEVAGANARLEVKAPSSTATATDAHFTVDVRNDVEAFYLVHDGSIQVQMDKQELSVGAGEQTLASVGRSLQSDLQVLANPIPSARPTEVPAQQVASNVEEPRVNVEAVAIQADVEALPVTYQVRAGDTFWTIAAQHNLNVERLAETNPQIEDVRFLQIGQEIKIVLHSQ